MKEMRFIRLLALAGLMCVPSLMTAQKSFQASVYADIVSRYIWRGTDKGGISIQPRAGIAWRGLSFDMQGSMGIDNDDPRELNLTLGYKLAGFNIGVTDYWTTGVDDDDRYFYYDNKKGAHTFEGNLGYSCKYFSLQAYCMFYGHDQKINGKQAYSTYVELAVPFKLATLDWQVRAGMTPFESSAHYVTKTIYTPLLGEREVQVPEYTYAEKTACVEAALRVTKDIDLGDVNMPVFAELNTNPYLKKASLIFGIGIKPW